MESLTPQPIDPSDELTVRGPVRVERKVAGVSAPKMSNTGNTEYDDLWNGYYRFITGEVVGESLDEPHANE